MTTDADLTNDEIDRICEGLEQNAAKIRYLKGLGLTVRSKPNGRPLVARSNYERVMGGLPGPASGRKTAPNWSVPA